MKPVRYNSVNAQAPAVGSFFDDIFSKNLTDFFGADQRSSIPAVNIRETDDDFTVELAAPGLHKEDFHINIVENHLELSAQKSSETSDSVSQYKRREFNYSSFTRKFFLPRSVDRHAISAAYTDGVLAVTLPKREEEKTITRTIEIS